MKSICLRLLASAFILSSGSAFADTSDMAKLFAKGSSFFNPKLSPENRFFFLKTKEISIQRLTRSLKKGSRVRGDARIKVQKI